MKKESGSPTAKPLSPIRQRTWRVTGGVAIACCALLTLFGGSAIGPQSPPWFLLAFWLAWLVSIGIAIYCVLLDIRYLRAAFLVEERDLYRETLASEEFRQALLDAQREQQDGENDRRGGPG